MRQNKQSPQRMGAEFPNRFKMLKVCVHILTNKRKGQKKPGGPGFVQRTTA